MPGLKRIVFDLGGTVVDKAPGSAFAAAELRARFRSQAGPGFIHVCASRLRGAPIFSQANHGLGGGTYELGRSRGMNGATNRLLGRRWRSGD